MELRKLDMGGIMMLSCNEHRAAFSVRHENAMPVLCAKLVRMWRQYGELVVKRR